MWDPDVVWTAVISLPSFEKPKVDDGSKDGEGWRRRLRMVARPPECRSRASAAFAADEQSSASARSPATSPYLFMSIVQSRPACGEPPSTPPTSGKLALTTRHDGTDDVARIRPRCSLHACWSLTGLPDEWRRHLSSAKLAAPALPPPGKPWRRRAALRKSQGPVGAANAAALMDVADGGPTWLRSGDGPNCTEAWLSCSRWAAFGSALIASLGELFIQAQVIVPE